MKRQLLLAVCLVLIGCGGGDSDSIFGSEQKVQYDIDSNGCFSNASDYSDWSEYTSGYYLNQTYYWYCADWSGNDDVYVSISVDNSDGCMKIYSEYIGDGIC